MITIYCCVKLVIMQLRKEITMCSYSEHVTLLLPRHEDLVKVFHQELLRVFGNTYLIFKHSTPTLFDAFCKAQTSFRPKENRMNIVSFD